MGFDVVKAGSVYSINQSVAMARFLSDMGVRPNTSIGSPMPTAKTMYEDGTVLDAEGTAWYRSAVGSLNYFAVASRYDIAHAVSRLSQHAHEPTVSARAALVRVLQYLQVQQEFDISVTRGVTTKDEIQIYSDSDHGGDRPFTTKSQTGTMIILNGAPVYWSSKKQNDSTAYSSALAEIYALSETVRAARLFAWRCEEMGMQITLPLCVQVDNQASISFQYNTCLQSRLRGCVDLREAWVQELRDQDKVKTVKVESARNKADILTKCFPTYKFKALMNLLHGQGRESERVALFITKIHDEYYE